MESVGDLCAICRSFAMLEVIFEMFHPVWISAGTGIYEFNELYHIIHSLPADMVLYLAGVFPGYFIQFFTITLLSAHLGFIFSEFAEVRFFRLRRFPRSSYLSWFSTLRGHLSRRCLIEPPCSHFDLDVIFPYGDKAMQSISVVMMAA